MRVVLFFIDGMGLASNNANNPLATTAMPCVNRLLGGKSLTQEALGVYEHATLLSLDATLGVPGLPQSATGQTSLFTGTNAAKALGRHLRGFPTEPLRKILMEEGILKKVLTLPKKATFLNGYRPEFFTELSAGERCYSVTTLMNLYADLPFYSFTDMARGKSVYSDITNEVLHEMGFDVPYVSPETAGEIFANNAIEYDFFLFEYFLTDMVAHKRNQKKIAQCLTTIDRYLASILARLDLSQTLFMITSDHGNLEDNTTSAHTANPVPLLLIGAGRENLRPITDLTEVTPFILEILQS